MVEESSGLSARKLAANRDNAKRSTGPKSQAGKERVRTNALKHGRSVGRMGRDATRREASVGRQAPPNPC